ncbi:Uncharacterised protein [Klebsiella pneumoniae]|nr:Uncharacterised protein [Klebsiella pneumoniae]
MFSQLIIRTFSNDNATMHPSTRADINNMVSCTDCIFIMFND